MAVFWGIVSVISHRDILPLIPPQGVKVINMSNHNLTQVCQPFFFQSKNRWIKNPLAAQEICRYGFPNFLAAFEGFPTKKKNQHGYDNAATVVTPLMESQWPGTSCKKWERVKKSFTDLRVKLTFNTLTLLTTLTLLSELMSNTWNASI